jgi:hypothetical protein
VVDSRLPSPGRLEVASSAKQDRTRRFHGLYDKVARSDVMWRAWEAAADTIAEIVLGIQEEPPEPSAG